MLLHNKEEREELGVAPDTRLDTPEVFKGQVERGEPLEEVTARPGDDLVELAAIIVGEGRGCRSGPWGLEQGKVGQGCKDNLPEAQLAVECQKQRPNASPVGCEDGRRDAIADRHL